MAPSTIRKALGAVKDQTSIGLAKVTSNLSPEVDVLVVKLTSHDDEPAEERHLRELLHLTSGHRAHISATVAAVSRRLSRTRDYVVALKSLMLVHRLLADGDPSFHRELLYASRRGTRLLNLSDFRDEAHSSSWDLSAFVRTYALYLDQRLEFFLHERKNSSPNSGPAAPSPRDRWGSPAAPSPRDRWGSPDPYNYSSYSSPPGNGYGSGHDDRRNSNANADDRKPPTPVRDMKPERLLGRMHHLQQLLERFLACRPTGSAKHSRMILIALYQIVRESFQLYADVCEVLAVVLDRFFDMEYPDCVKAFEAYASGAKQIDELCAFYAWCKETGVARSSEYPDVQRVTDKLLETLEEFMRDKARCPKSPPREPVPEPVKEEEEPVQDMNSIKALPAPEDYKEPEPVKVEVEVKKPVEPEPDLVDLREATVSADEQGNRLALALFSGPPAANGTNGSWEAFPSNGGNEQVTSAWQNPAAEPGKADWELALVETASHLSKQKATMAGGLDPLLLTGMYDSGVVRQHVSSQVNTGSASSVALPAPGQKTQVLALPAPDGSMQAVGGGDPFAASLSFPPPSYVQMAELEKKQQFLSQEQMMWQQYQRDGMQGQSSLAKLDRTYNNGFMPNPGMPYGMPMPMGYTGSAMPMTYTANAGYHYPTY